MRRLVVLGLCIAATAAACGGSKIPQHNGYKSENAHPWKKPKVLKLNDKLEAKSDGDLSYPERRRAAWFEIDTPSTGALDFRVEITPPGDAVNEEFDLGFEVLDPLYKVLTRSDLDDPDAHELNKKASIPDLPAGKYLIHLYLQGRLDTAEYVLHASFRPAAPQALKSDFPVQVAYVPILPMVPIDDDVPKGWHPDKPVIVTHTPHGPFKPATPTKPPPQQVVARIIGVSVVGKNTLIKIGRGTSSGADPTMMAKIQGIAGSFHLDSCDEHTCVATVSATLDQIKKASSVVLTGP